MSDGTRTSTALLEALSGSDAAVWWEFDDRYRPIIVGIAVRAGLSHADAEDVAQETMVQFMREYRAGGYDRTRGRLRAWLIAITRSKIAQLRRRRGRASMTRDNPASLDPADERRLGAAWEIERRRQALRVALHAINVGSHLHEKTLRAFELLVLRGVPAEGVARQLDISVHDVYLAKSRVAKRLRLMLIEMESAYDNGPPGRPPVERGR